MNVFESLVLSYLLNSLWQVPLLFVAGWVAVLGVRRTGAAAEHRVWVSVLLLQAALPALSLLPWGGVSWQWLRMLKVWSHAGAADAHVAVVMGTGHTSGSLGISDVLSATALFAYVAVSLYFGTRFLWRMRMLALLRREAVGLSLTGEAAQSWFRCSRQFGIDNASIAASSRVFGPVTMGHGHKLVLLPATMVGTLPQEDFETVIAHEFAHMRRNDFTRNVLYELLSLPIAYHPLLWLTQERITESREMICDQMAADVSGRNAYARSLLRLASLLVHGTPVRIPHAIGIFDANTFERRLMKLTDVTKEVCGAQRIAVLAACAAFGAATCGTALALRTDVSAQPDQKSSSTTPKKVMIASGVMAGNKLTGDNPKYPVAAKKAKIQGKVVLAAVISKDGDIENLRIVSGPKELQDSAMDAVKTWKYKPYLLNGDPVEVETTINVVYSLAG